MTRKNISKEKLHQQVPLSPSGLYLETMRPYRVTQHQVDSPNPHKGSTCVCPMLSRGAKSTTNQRMVPVRSHP